MRNEDRKLENKEATMVATRTRQLRERIGQRVTLEYVKRDSTASSSTGTVVEVTPNGSKGIVKIEADGKGFRSINLYNVTKVIAL